MTQLPKLVLLFLIACPSATAFVTPQNKNGAPTIAPSAESISNTFKPIHPTTTSSSASSSSSSTQLHAINPLLLKTATTAALSLRAGAPAPVDVSDIVVSAYDWCVNLGAPSALVAGAVIATIYENFSSGAVDIQKQDSKYVRFGKRCTRILLLSAFALEVMSIFVTTVTGTMLLSRTLDAMDEMVEVTMLTTPLSFLRENFEFEFLTARITFLQGLLNWLGAIAIGHVIPSDGESRDDRNMNKFVGGALFTTVTIMLAFYNKHVDFYRNYGHMCFRWAQLIFQRFVACWPFRPLAIFYVPSMIATFYYGIEAFFDADHDDDKEEKNGEAAE